MDILNESGVLPGGWPEYLVDLDMSAATTAATGPVSICNIPDGQGSSLDMAQTLGGYMDATITVTLVDPMGVPVAGYPWEDLWIESSASGLAFSPGGTHPDGPTDANGTTTFTGPFQAGGHTQSGEALMVMVDAHPIASSTVQQISCNSPDIDGDLDVDLMDLTWFAEDYMCGPYEYRSDFQWDGVINLLDLSVFGGAWGTGDRTNAVVDPLRGIVEIYFDDGSGFRRHSLPDTVGIVEAIMVLQTPEPDVVAWEMQLEVTGDATIVGQDFNNFLSGPQLLAVAVCPPLAVIDGEVELGRFTLQVGPGEPVEIFIRPMDPSSIPLTDQPAFLTSARDAYKAMMPISGDCSIPVAVINSPESGVPRDRVIAQPPEQLVFHPASPNPFNAATTLRFDLPGDLACRLTIFDMAGRRVRTILDGNLMRAGRREVIWDGRDQLGRLAATGVYFARLEAGTWTRNLRLALVK